VIKHFVVIKGGAHSGGEVWRILPYQYTGREADTAGLYFCRARYYSPMMGSFISEDPIGFDGGQLSFYGYAGSDPVGFADPDGLAATVQVSGNNVNITLAISYVGPGASNQQLINTWNQSIEQNWSGQIGNYNVTTTVIPGGPGVSNTNTITVPASAGRSYVNGVGGNTGTWYAEGQSGSIEPWVPAHESGHLMGLPDHYTDVCKDGKLVSEPSPGFEHDIMGAYGAPVTAGDIQGIINAHKHWWQ
jgi:RHS repeat-associated protein